jgi:hypothetical protein
MYWTINMYQVGWRSNVFMVLLKKKNNNKTRQFIYSTDTRRCGFIRVKRVCLSCAYTAWSFIAIWQEVKKKKRYVAYHAHTPTDKTPWKHPPLVYIFLIRSLSLLLSSFRERRMSGFCDTIILLLDHDFLAFRITRNSYFPGDSFGIHRECLEYLII